MAPGNQGFAPYYRDLRSQLSRNSWKGSHHPRAEVRKLFSIEIKILPIKPIPRVFPILWTLVCPLIDETSRAKFLFYATDGQRGDQLAAQSAGLRCDLIPFFF